MVDRHRRADRHLKCVHNAAFDTSYAMLVPENKLPRANGMMQTILPCQVCWRPVSRPCSLPACIRPQGPVTGLRHLPGADTRRRVARHWRGRPDFLLGGAGASVPLHPLTVTREKRFTTATGKQKSLCRYREGVVYIWQRRSFLWLLGTFTVANFHGGTRILQPLIVKFQLAADWGARGFQFEGAFALITTTAGIGGLLGGVFITAWGGLKRRVLGVLVPLIIPGLATVVLALHTGFSCRQSPSLAAGMVPFMNAHSQTIWQTQTPRELQGACSRCAG